jgi:pimeloyl-ACP methyl ester carboxylesterase
MAWLERDGVKLYYEIHGDGPTLLLTHGFAASADMWAGQRDAFARHCKLIVWDMRGHGRSDYPDDPAAYSEGATIADMAALLDAAGAADAVIGGLSLGGYMSLAFHAAHPARTRALLIVDTGPGFRSDDARAAWNATAQKTADRFDAEGLFRLRHGGVESRGAPHRDATGLAHAARGMLAQRDAAVIDSLPSIAVPALVVVGENDAPFLNAANYMAAKIPGARKAVIPKAGHAANIDQKDAFNAAVLAFLQGCGVVVADAVNPGEK